MTLLQVNSHCGENTFVWLSSNRLSLALHYGKDRTKILWSTHVTMWRSTLGVRIYRGFGQLMLCKHIQHVCFIQPTQIHVSAWHHRFYHGSIIRRSSTTALCNHAINTVYPNTLGAPCSLVSRLPCIALKCDIIHPLHLRLRNLVCDVWNVRRCMVYCMWEAMFSKVYHPIGIPCYIVFSISGTGCQDTCQSSSWTGVSKDKLHPAPNCGGVQWLETWSGHQQHQLLVQCKSIGLTPHTSNTTTVLNSQLTSGRGLDSSY